MLFHVTLLFGTANLKTSMPEPCENIIREISDAGHTMTSRMIADHTAVSFASHNHASSALAILPGSNDPKTGQGADERYKPLSKRGLAFVNVRLVNSFRTYCPGCSRAYNWGPGTEDLSKDLSFVPMPWDDSQDRTANWALNMAKAISDGCKEVLSFNEPDNAGQANTCQASQPLQGRNEDQCTECLKQDR